MKSKTQKLKSVFWLIRPYLQYGKVYLLIFFAMGVFIIPIEEYIYVTLPRNIINMLTRGISFFYVSMFAVSVLMVDFLISILPTLFSPYLEKRGNEIGLKINRDIYEKTLEIDYKYIDQPDYYDKYTWALDQYRNQAKESRNLIREFLTNFISVSILFSLIIDSAPLIIVLEIFKLCLDFIIAKKRNQTFLDYRNSLIPIQRRLSYVHRIFYQKEYSPDLRSTSLSKLIFNSYNHNSIKYVNITEYYTKKISFYDVLHELVFLITQIIIYTYVIGLISSGHVYHVGLFITLTISFYRLDERLTHIFYSFVKFDELSLCSRKIQEFFNMESTIEKSHEESNLPEDGAFSITLDDISFSYPNTNFSISNLSLKIQKGEKIAVVGYNAAGKSTLTKLLLRFYDVNSGKILINGLDIKSYNTKQLRKHIGVAFQNPQIYAASYKDNLELYRSISKDDIIKITKDLGLETFLDDKVSFETELTREFTQDGIILSGGEIQKISIARIMNGDFGLLILDEPSSSLDPISESKFINLLLSEANRTTTIIISHRLSTILDADKIVLMRNGKIIEIGSHDELLKLGGMYHKIFTTQAEKYRIN